VILAKLIVTWGTPLGVPYILLGFAFLTMILTQPMSNAAAALVVLPVAITAARQLHVEPRTFAVVVTLVASISYITPFEPPASWSTAPASTASATSWSSAPRSRCCSSSC
jgi:di/tricarboxylate transporter